MLKEELGHKLKKVDSVRILEVTAVKLKVFHCKR